MSVCPGRRKGGKSVCPTLGLTQGPGSFVRFVRPCVRAARCRPVRVSDSGADSGARFVREVRSVCPGQVRLSGLARARVSGPGVRLWGSTLGLTQGPGSFVCPGQVRPGRRRFKSVCPGRRKGGKSVCPTLGLTQGPGSFVRFVRLSGLARARVSGPVRPTLGLDSGADSGARFVRVSGPGSSVSPSVQLARARVSGPG